MNLGFPQCFELILCFVKIKFRQHIQLTSVVPSGTLSLKLSLKNCGRDDQHRKQPSWLNKTYFNFEVVISKVLLQTSLEEVCIKVITQHGHPLPPWTEACAAASSHLDPLRCVDKTGLNVPKVRSIQQCNTNTPCCDGNVLGSPFCTAIEVCFDPSVVRRAVLSTQPLLDSHFIG